MNELIKTIAHKYESPDQINRVFVNNTWYYSIHPSSYESFAKDIIKECIKSIKDRTDYFGPTAVDDLELTIKDHFRLTDKDLEKKESW